MKRKNRPLLPNHRVPVADIIRDQCSTGKLSYSADVCQYGEQFGINHPIQTVKQKENRYTRQNFYGVELEMVTNKSTGDLYRSTSYPFFVVKEDSSISGAGSNRAEVVSVPMSLKCHKLLWSEFINNIQDSTDCSDNHTNGMHVHVDRENFIDRGHLKRFLWFFSHPAHIPYLYDVSERPNWDSIVDYSRFDLGEINSWRETKKSDLYRSLTSHVGNNRGAINTRNSKTIEVRIFKGIVSIATVIKNLEFVDSVVEYTKERSVKQILWPEYVRWLNNETENNRYKLLKKFVDNHLAPDSKEEFTLVKQLFKQSPQTIKFKETKTFNFDTRRTNFSRRFRNMPCINIQNDIVTLSRARTAGKLWELNESVFKDYVFELVGNTA